MILLKIILVLHWHNPIRNVLALLLIIHIFSRNYIKIQVWIHVAEQILAGLVFRRVGIIILLRVKSNHSSIRFNYENNN